MTETMSNDKSFQNQYDIINPAFNVLKNILLSVAMLMRAGDVPEEIPKNIDRDDLFSTPKN